MKRICSWVLCAAMLLSLAACGQGSQEEIFSQAVQDGSSTASVSSAEGGAPEETNGASGEITLMTLYKDDFTTGQMLVEGFNKTHPDAKVVIEGIANRSEVNSTDDAIAVEERYAQRLATELMGGEADFLLDDAGVLDPTKYADSGLFYDIREWMDADPDFHMEDYFENIFDACGYDGHLYSAPIGFVLTPVYLNKNIVDKLGLQFEPLDRINYEQLFQIGEDAKAAGLLSADSGLEFAGTGTSMRFMVCSAELPDYIDLSAKEARFDSPEFIKFLEDTQEYFAPRTPTGIMGVQVKDFSDAIAMMDDRFLYANSPLSLDPMAVSPLDDIPENCVGPLILESVKGNIVCNPGFTVSVPKSCTQPELAWEFIKSCIAAPETPGLYSPTGSYEGVDVSGGKLPVNRDNLVTYAKLYGTFNQEDSPLLEKLADVLGQISTSGKGTGPLEQLVTPTMMEFYENKTISAEECAKQMQEKAELYLNE